MAISLTSSGLNGMSFTSSYGTTGGSTYQPSAPSVGAICYVACYANKSTTIKLPSSGSYFMLNCSQGTSSLLMWPSYGASPTLELSGGTGFTFSSQTSGIVAVRKS